MRPLKMLFVLSSGRVNLGLHRTASRRSVLHDPGGKRVGDRHTFNIYIKSEGSWRRTMERGREGRPNRVTRRREPMTQVVGEASGAEREKEDTRFWFVIGVAAVGIKVGGSPGELASPSHSPPALPSASAA